MPLLSVWGWILVQRLPLPNPQNLGLLPHVGREILQVGLSILMSGNCLRWSAAPDIITPILRDRGRRSRRQRRRPCDDGSTVRRCCTAGFEAGGRGHEPKIAGTSRNWKGQVNGFSPGTSRRNQRCKRKNVLFLASLFMVICSSSSRELIHLFR